MQSSLFVVAAFTATTAAAGTITPLTNFGSNPGALAAYDHIPASLPLKAPLVVVLHGCTQTAAAMESAGWNALADEYGFAVLYPEQATGNNPVRCFNWAGEYGNTANLERGKGENASIMSMIDAEIAAHGLDPSRIYVVGLSAGAAMTTVMLATWPERFAGGSIMAGIPYRCATSVNGAFSCQSPGVTKLPAQWGDLVRAASPHTGAFPRVQIWQGTSDTTVAPMNAQQLVAQWTNVHGSSSTATSTTTNGAATVTAYGSGVELWSISGMGHGISIGGDDCPATAGAYFLDTGVCSTAHTADFFGLTNGASPPDDDEEPAAPGGNDDACDSTIHDGGLGCNASTPRSVWAALVALTALVTRRRKRA